MIASDVGLLVWTALHWRIACPNLGVVGLVVALQAADHVCTCRSTVQLSNPRPHSHEHYQIP